VSSSNGVNRSNGVSWSNGVNRSNGVNWSGGVNGSNGVNWSFGLLDCLGIFKSLFCIGQSGKFLIFNKQSTEKRIDEIFEVLYSKLNGWRPTYNNIKALWFANGSDWKLTPVKDAKELQKEEAWADMPTAAIEYVRSLPEFDADIFEKITGLKARQTNE